MQYFPLIDYRVSIDEHSISQISMAIPCHASEYCASYAIGGKLHVNAIIKDAYETCLCLVGITFWTNGPSFKYDITVNE